MYKIDEDILFMKYLLSTTLILWGSDTKKSFPSTAAFLAAGTAAGLSKKKHMYMFCYHNYLKIAINNFLWKVDFKSLAMSQILWTLYEWTAEDKAISQTFITTDSYCKQTELQSHQ